MSDFLFRGSLKDLDPKVHELNQIEAERQYRRLILIPSESASPLAVREALGSAFHNIYAEGYPDDDTRWMNEDEILDYTKSLQDYRRYSDPRYYKGTEYANIVEALARRRAAETFAENGVSPNELYINIQALSGGAANNAVYHALVNPGDTVMGMNLLHGGHLSHGSPVNRSGKYYTIVHYTVDPDTERINYESIEELAREHKPKMIIAGFSSYPWAADWETLRAIADSVGAYLFADISHVAGLIAAGAYPSPVGHAHIITSTTHKTLCGPRGAIIITTDAHISRKIDRAVFPGEQGGPHVNTFPALALAFKLAQTDQFKKLQKQIIKNCIAFTKQLEKRGFRIPFGGTNTHLMNLDTKSVAAPDGTPLSGDMAARILDLAGIVVNRNTIPGDKSALNPSGIRMGTPWITQRGFIEKETRQLADIIADILDAITPYRLKSRKTRNLRAKIDFGVLEEAKLRVRELALNAGIDFDPPAHKYPHFYYIDDQPESDSAYVALGLSGERIRSFLNTALSCHLEEMIPGDTLSTNINTPSEMVSGTLKCLSLHEFHLSVAKEKAGITSAWLRSLSDGFISIDDDLLKKSPGPVTITVLDADGIPPSEGDPVGNFKPYFIGISNSSGESLPNFEFKSEGSNKIKKTELNKIHRKLGAKMVEFAGWEMPVRYTSVIDEHKAVREAAGIFDVSHMGIFQAEGADAAVFIDNVCTNDIAGLKQGRATYTHFLDPHANVIDDLFVYHIGIEKYLLVVNAANHNKDWSWLNAVKNGEVSIDNQRPWARAFGGRVQLLDLHDLSQKKDMLIVLALQGPRSRDILLSMDHDTENSKKIMKLKRNDITQVILGGVDLIVARTGYTGEKMGFEIFVHPDQSTALWQTLLDAGDSAGLKPCGLGARDSLRTEAGLPLYGNEMGGKLNLGVADAGFRTFVKTYKPWFIGRESFLERERDRSSEIVRFRFNDKGVRPAHNGDPVVNKRGHTIGVVTSCALNSEGLLTGQAYIELKYNKHGTTILIFQSAPNKSSKAPAKLIPGDKVTIPTPAEVISRFL